MTRFVGGDLDPRQARGTARGIAGRGDDREDHLAVKLDPAVGQNGIIAERRTAVVDAGNVLVA